MGLIILIVPLLIYYAILVPIIKKGIIDKVVESKQKRMIILLLVMLFPVGDHIVGYIVYKTLCFTNGGVHIYKTVTNKQEQLDYWFYDGLNVFDNSYDDKEYHFFANNGLVKRGICTNLLKDGNVGERVCAKGGFKIVYLNYCNSKYDSLPKDDPNYHRSCKNAEEIIKQYHLKNVIKVPKRKYVFYTNALEKGMDREIFLFPFISKDIQKIKNIKTGEVLAKYIGFAFWGGWYINLFNPYHHGALSRCGKRDKKDLYDYQTRVIPNPYKNKN
ncbi:hypothetical protein [Sulfurospirillum sp. 1612]|uniref:hypothetical protein n=1 Tax=Sulfurospirillum sp. 1612 TaxID=3094835 RepID=UPI002F93D154